MKTVEQLASETVFSITEVKEVFEITKDINMTDCILKKANALQISPLYLSLYSRYISSKNGENAI